MFWRRKINLLDLLKAEMPNFVKAVASMEAKGGEEAGVLIMAQAAFPKLEERELFLLGAAIKYAGSKGVTVTIAADGSDRTSAH